MVLTRPRRCPSTGGLGEREVVSSCTPHLAATAGAGRVLLNLRIASTDAILVPCGSAKAVQGLPSAGIPKIMMQNLNETARLGLTRRDVASLPTDCRSPDRLRGHSCSSKLRQIVGILRGCPT